MSTPKPLHPVRRIREALKKTPEQMGLRQYSTSAGFAKLLGCSSSLIRNVESGFTKKSHNLALLIQRKIGVSAEWLLSSPEPESPILDSRHRPWDPGRHLDPLAPGEGTPDWRMVMNASPGTLVTYVSMLVEIQLALELSLGYQDFLEQLVRSFRRAKTFANPALDDARENISRILGEGFYNRLFRTSCETAPPGFLLHDLLESGAKNLKAEDLRRLLEEEGIGWTKKLKEREKEGIIGAAKKFYMAEGRHLENREDEEDSETE